MINFDSVGVYVDSDVCHYHFKNLEAYHNFRVNDYFIEPSKLENFVASDNAIRFSAFHVPFVDDPWLERFWRAYAKSNKTFVFCSELHHHTVMQLEHIDRPNVIIFACGFLNYDFKHAKVYTWMDWFITSSYVYKEVKPNLLNEKLIIGPKPKYFDILLGVKRTHRDFVYDYIKSNNLDNQVIMTYYQSWNVDLRETEFIFEDEGIEFLPESSYTKSVHMVNYFGFKTNVCSIVPTNIYNQTYYSLVAETNYIGGFCFYTEKIVKPILAGRLFIVIGAPWYLYNLRNLGFKTFHDIIDESYDGEENDIKRWTMALEQLKRLMDEDPSHVYPLIEEIVDHNRNHMLTTDWYKNVVDIVNNEIIDSLTVHKVAG